MSHNSAIILRHTPHSIFSFCRTIMAKLGDSPHSLLSTINPVHSPNAEKNRNLFHFFILVPRAFFLDALYTLSYMSIIVTITYFERSQLNAHVGSTTGSCLDARSRSPPGNHVFSLLMPGERQRATSLGKDRTSDAWIFAWPRRSASKVAGQFASVLLTFWPLSLSFSLSGIATTRATRSNRAARGGRE